MISSVAPTRSSTFTHILITKSETVTLKAKEKFEKWDLKMSEPPSPSLKGDPPGIEKHREVFFCGIQSEAEVHTTRNPTCQSGNSIEWQQ